MNNKQLQEILEKHKKWLNNETDGNSANLRGANLRGANLSGADLSGIIYNENTAFLALVCPEKGSFTAYKKLDNNLIAELKIPAKAKRSSATTRKCRASEAKVVAIYNPTTKEKVNMDASNHQKDYIYI